MKIPPNWKGNLTRLIKMNWRQIDITLFVDRMTCNMNIERVFELHFA
jgi:hypothetical protein